ncbi:hypothetical protein HDV00_006167 [Rhizophlyctis rosea]|nr:hypothetical protein HDV00_006167 [Rhizophlyctis rosea]
MVAPYFGLDPLRNARDIPRTDIRLARLPAQAWLSILDSAGIVEQEVGESSLHANEEARSQWINGWFRDIVALFDSRVRNIPQLTLPASVTRGKRVEFQYFLQGACLVVLMETKHSLHTTTALNDQIAQLMVEMTSAHEKNFKNDSIATPLYGILTDGTRYVVFEFDGLARSFKRASTDFVIGIGSNEEVATGMEKVCQVFFWLLLRGWCLGLQAFEQRSEYQRRGETEGQKRRRLKAWTKSKVHAFRALRLATEAQSENDDLKADDLAMEALANLKQSLEVMPVDRQAPYQETQTYGRYVDLLARRKG